MLPKNIRNTLKVVNEAEYSAYIEHQIHNDPEYHQHISQIQLEHQRLRKNMEDGYKEDEREQIDEHPEILAYEITEEFDRSREAALAYLRHQTAQLIATERMIFRGKHEALFDAQNVQS